MFPNSQHFAGWRACWSFEMGLKWTHKQEFKMKSTYTTKKKGRLVQVEWKWWSIVGRVDTYHKAIHIDGLK
jgi:hypothetical protein